MKVMPTLEGGLRVDLDDGGDWMFLESIRQDIAAAGPPLAERLGAFVNDEELAEDWRDYVVPDLDLTFSTQLRHVVASVASARAEAADGPGTLWIRREDTYVWFATLNQARLALEERYRFGPGDRVDPLALPLSHRQVYLRSQFYCALQSLLLENGMV